MWNHFDIGKFLQSPPLGQNGFITSLTKSPDHMEVWWIAHNGSVHNAYFYETQNPTWKKRELAPPESANPSGGIAAVSRKSNTIDIWWIGPNNSIEGSHWDEHTDWKRYQLAPNGSAVQRSKIYAQSRTPTHLNVIWIDPHGSIEASFYEERSMSWTRYQIAGNGSAALNSSLTAVSRIPTSEEVYWQSPQGSVERAYWNLNDLPVTKPWRRSSIPLYGNVAIGSGMTAVSRVPEIIDLYWINTYGAVIESYWIDKKTPWNSYEIAPSNSASLNTGLTALSRKPNTESVWYVGPNGELIQAYWYDGYPNWRYRYLEPAGSVPTNSCITSVSRNNNKMEIWYQSKNNTLDDWFFYNDIPPINPIRRWRTKFKLYIANSCTLTDKYQFNFYTNKWAGVELRNYKIPKSRIFIDNNNPYGLLITENPDDDKISLIGLPKGPGNTRNLGDPDNNGSYTTELADGVHFGGYAVIFDGDWEFERIDCNPQQITDFFDNAFKNGECPDGILDFVIGVENNIVLMLKEYDILTSAQQASLLDVASGIVTCRVININIYEEKEKNKLEINFPPDAVENTVIR
jgi:hypothetical protein